MWRGVPPVHHDNAGEHLALREGRLLEQLVELARHHQCHLTQGHKGEQIILEGGGGLVRVADPDPESSAFL